MVFLFTLAMLLVILAASEVFVNALEHLGERLRISEGVTGSLFAAVGTALPETIVPLIAIFAGTKDQTVNEEIGVGAILGAPLMLATLAMGLLAVTCFRSRGTGGAFQPEPGGLRRDLNFFLIAFSLATLALFIPREALPVRVGVGMGLVLLYFVYVLLTLRASGSLVESGHGTEADRPLFLARIGLPAALPVIVVQIVIGLLLLVGGAKGFIQGVEAVAELLGVSALLVSLLIVPLATELPEKVNSILWVRRRKDTLAFGNLTGALVFQGTLLPALGVTLTPWEPRAEMYYGVVMTLAGALWLRYLISRGGLRVWHLAVNGLLYLLFLGLTLSR
jgi:cation:H+ antiporter